MSKYLPVRFSLDEVLDDLQEHGVSTYNWFLIGDIQLRDVVRELGCYIRIYYDTGERQNTVRLRKVGLGH